MHISEDSILIVACYEVFCNCLFFLSELYGTVKSAASAHARKPTRTRLQVCLLVVGAHGILNTNPALSEVQRSERMSTTDEQSSSCLQSDRPGDDAGSSAAEGMRVVFMQCRLVCSPEWEGGRQTDRRSDRQDRLRTDGWPVTVSLGLWSVVK